MRIAEFQKLIEDIYFAKDSERGMEGSFMWFAEEVGELSRALRRREPVNLKEEFADVFAWMATLASITGVSLEDAAQKYAGGCPRCHHTPCACDERRRTLRYVEEE